MTYESPKQIRRRQTAAESRSARRRSRRTPTIAVLDDEGWDATCDQHVACLLYWGKRGYAESAGREARALVHMAIERRAYQIMRDFGRARWKAMAMARHELLNCEV